MRVTASLLQTFLFALTLITMPAATLAKGTSSAIRGTIVTTSGDPVENAAVIATDTRTGRASRSATNAAGRFQMDGLAVGGPYTVTVTTDRYDAQRVTDIMLGLDATFELELMLSADRTMEEVVVTASMADTVQVAVGPSSSFNFDDLQNLPSFNRDIRDVVRVDPRIYIDEAFVGAVQCIGANPRFNSLTVDGVKMNDNFGLNSNGYPTQRQPFPYDAIQNVSLELSPFDVQYGGFTACNINAVTRAGTNEVKGHVWYDYTDSDLKGDKLEGASVPIGNFDEKRWGFSFGGPVIEDTFFLFASYEKADGADIFDRCAGDQSCGRPVAGVTAAQLDRIADIARNVYGYDPGPVVSSLPNEDEKFLIRADYFINEMHRAALTYVYNDGFNMTESDSDSFEFEFSNHYYERGAELESWAGQLFSDWSDSFSTEVRVAVSTLDNRQITRNSQGFGEVQIETYADVDGDGNFSQALVYLGGDDSRQSNLMNYDTFNFKVTGTYEFGNHIISGGYEQEQLDIFNVFVQHTVGEYRFDESNTDLDGNGVGCSFGARPSGCIDQFEALSPDDIYYGNAPSLNPNDAAAEFGYTSHALYVQDEISFYDIGLTVVAGLRWDWWTSSDVPRQNQNFVARYGYSNSQNFDGESLLQPRIGFTWDVSDNLVLRGGVGLYSGGNPNVWLSNAYSNDGFTAIQAREFNGGVADLNVNPLRSLATIPLGADGNGRPIFDAPTSLRDYVSGASTDSGVNGIDPNFKIPSNLKWALGGTYVMDNGYEFSGDLIYTRSDDSAIYVDATYVEFSKAPDGRPVYYQADVGVPGCTTNPVETGPSCNRLFSGDYILSNVQGSDGTQFSFSGSVRKEYDLGLDVTFGYAYTESREVSPMTSSVAFSNFSNIAVDDYNYPTIATSNYEIPHRFILRASYSRDFFPGLTTRITLFGARNKGRPYSYTFADQEMFVRGPFFFPSDDRALLYMPSSTNDPKVVFGPDFNRGAFFAFAEAEGLSQYGGGIVPRNEFYSAWWTKFDVRINQELPGFVAAHRANAYLVIENVGNLLNDDWGVLYERSFPRNAPIVQASYIDAAGTPNDHSDDQYLFERYIPQTQSRVADASLWGLRFGVNYRF